MAAGIAESEIDLTNTEKLMTLWVNNYDTTKNIPGMTNARRNYFIRLDKSLEGLLATEGEIIAAKNPQTGTLEQTGIINQSDYREYQRGCECTSVTAWNR